MRLEISVSRPHDYETTRLKSTCGAGIGSLLLNEGAILNPASVAFFDISSMYFQKESSSILNSEKIARKLGIDSNFKDLGSTGFILSDGNAGGMSGALAYQSQSEDFYERNRLSISLSKRVGKFSTLGVIFRKTTDTLTLNNSTGSLINDEEKYNQFVIGTNHVIGKDLTMGVVIIDPFKTKKEDVRGAIGFQYNFQSLLALIFDFGANYTESIQDQYFVKTAIQVNFFKDIFFRLGYFKDEILDEEGTGYGVSWVSPKLSFDFAIKETRLLENTQVYKNNFKESSFSVSYRF